MQTPQAKKPLPSKPPRFLMIRETVRDWALLKALPTAPRSSLRSMVQIGAQTSIRYLRG